MQPMKPNFPPLNRPDPVDITTREVEGIPSGICGDGAADYD